ncbi:MAG: RES family NAD+ phosphorylase [Acidimicrobiia bacterium]|jgi:hypothetical protein|nr:RES family NAD+ phosphorylase [Acidimicrobiia bacterium]
MPLGEPPDGAGSLAAFPAHRVAGTTLHRVWRYRSRRGVVRPQPWWFASVPDDAAGGRRFDLPAPMGTCYLATTACAAVLEALQAHLVNLPIDELRARRRVELCAPADAPVAADLVAPSVAGRFGITAAMWAGGDRPLTQRWAYALRRDGWWAIRAGIQHDPTGGERGVALFDHQGSHPPTGGSGGWPHVTHRIDDDADLAAELSTWGVTVRGTADLPFA